MNRIALNFGESQTTSSQQSTYQETVSDLSRAQLANPLDAESKGSLKNALKSGVLAEISRAQYITLNAGATSIEVSSSDCMVLTGDSGSNTIATITNGYSGQLLTIVFNFLVLSVFILILYSSIPLLLPCLLTLASNP